MEVKVKYSKVQFEETVNFIANNNRYFLYKHDEVRDALLGSIEHMVKKFPNCKSTGTMGYHINTSYLLEEGIDNEENIMYLDFKVDPSVTNNKRDYDFDKVVQCFEVDNLCIIK